jgi:hypothetical protein
MQVDEVAWFEVPGHGLGSDPRKAHLALRVVRVDKVDVERDLTVDTDGLNFLNEGRAGAFEHVLVSEMVTGIELAVKSSPRLHRALD